MVHVIPSADRHAANLGWLSTRWHFSFDQYYDPNNIHWGALRVFNDDVVQPGKGFGMHPHRDMEIVTYVLEGALEHQDNIGTKEILRAGESQVMSAGKGIVHSEYNASRNDPVHFLQLWIVPRTRGLKPRWEQRGFAPEARAGKLLPIVTPAENPIDGSLGIDQDATIFLTSLRQGEKVSHSTGPDRKQYLFVMDGAVKLNNSLLKAGDQGRVGGETNLQLEGVSGAELMLLDLPDLR